MRLLVAAILLLSGTATACSTSEVEQLGDVTVSDRLLLQEELRVFAADSLAEAGIDSDIVPELVFDSFASSMDRADLPSDCVGGKWPTSTYEGAAYYCSSDGRVVWDVLLGSGPPDEMSLLELLIVAHEVGHHYEHHRHLDVPGSARLIEETADCFTGAFLKSNDAASALVEDARSLESLFHSVPLSYSRSEGSLRFPALVKGWELGIIACSAELSELLE